MAALTLLIRSPDAKAERRSVHWMKLNGNRCPLHVCPTRDNSIAVKQRVTILSMTIFCWELFTQVVLELREKKTENKTRSDILFCQSTVDRCSFSSILFRSILATDWSGMNENFICHCQGERQISNHVTETTSHSRLLQTVIEDDDPIEEHLENEHPDVLKRRRKKWYPDTIKKLIHYSLVWLINNARSVK